MNVCGGICVCLCAEVSVCMCVCLCARAGVCVFWDWCICVCTGDGGWCELQLECVGDVCWGWCVCVCVYTGVLCGWAGVGGVCAGTGVYVSVLEVVGSVYVCELGSVCVCACRLCVC